MDIENTTTSITKVDVVQLNRLLEEDPRLYDAIWLADYFRNSLFAVPANRFDLSVDEWRELAFAFQSRFQTLLFFASPDLQKEIIQAIKIFFNFRSSQTEERKVFRAGVIAILKALIKSPCAIALPLVQEGVGSYVRENRFDGVAFDQDRKKAALWIELASCYGSHAISVSCWMQLIEYSLPTAIFAYQAMMNERSDIGAFQLGLIYERWISYAKEDKKGVMIEELVNAFLLRWSEGETFLRMFQNYYEHKGLWSYIEAVFRVHQRTCAAQ